MAKQDTGEPIDPAFKYTDKQIKPVKAKLQRLAEAHDAVAAEQKEISEKLTASLLRTQIWLADFMVITWAQLYRNIIDTSTRNIDKSRVVNQLVSDTTRAKTEIRMSKDPISIAAKFEEQWTKNMGDLGFPITLI